MKKLFPLIFFSVLFCFFLYHSIVILEPDFGWYYRLGEIIYKNGIPKTDPFSYTMPSFPLVDHEWFSNLITYLTYSRSGLLANALFAAFPILVFVICIGKLKREYVPFVILAAAAILSFSGIRIQEVSWVFFAVLIILLFDSKRWTKWRFFVPLVFVFWVNLHGGFAIGITTLAIYVLVMIFQKKLTKEDLTIFVLSFVATFINPYGSSIWATVFKHTGNSNLSLRIAEWLPGFLFLDISFFVLLSIFLVLLFCYRSRLSLFQLTLFVLVFLLSITGARHIPFIIIVIVALLPTLIDGFINSLKNREQKNRFNKVINVIILLACLSFLYKFYTTSIHSDFLKKNYYPGGLAITALSKNAKNGEIFADYKWGGYLLLKIPDRKVFVSGLMPVWKWSAPAGESRSAFDDYDGILSGGKNYKPIFKKYNIHYVFLPHEKKNNQLIKALHIIRGDKGGFSLQKKLMEDKWREVYEDKNTVLYSDI